MIIPYDLFLFCGSRGHVPDRSIAAVPRSVGARLVHLLISAVFMVLFLAVSPAYAIDVPFTFQDEFGVHQGVGKLEGNRVTGQIKGSGATWTFEGEIAGNTISVVAAIQAVVRGPEQRATPPVKLR